MKPLGRFEPEPPPPHSDIWKVSIALTLLVLGIGIVLFSFHDSGAISDEAYLAAMIFVIAVCAGVIIAMDMEQQAHRDARRRWQEIPPPYDFIALWSPEDNECIGDDPENQREVRPRKPPATSRMKKP
jgi:hypothetical protein